MYSLPDLPYDYDALEPYIDTKTMQIHHKKHHGAYVENLNKALADYQQFHNMSITELMKSLDQVPQEIRTAVRNNGGGHANHSLFWTIMKPNGGGEPQGELAEAIIEAFGDFSSFKEEFTKAALGRFGSGWAWLIVDNGKLVVTSTPNQDTPLMENKTPILGLDVWEHAYYLKYQNRRADYVKAWWNIVNWQKVLENFRQEI